MSELNPDRSRQLINLSAAVARLRGKRAVQSAADLVAMELSGTEATALAAALLPARVVPAHERSLQLELIERETNKVAWSAVLPIQELKAQPSAALPLAVRGLLAACGLPFEDALREVPEVYQPPPPRDFATRYEVGGAVETRRASELAELLITGETAVALIGHSAAGKSTTAAQVCSRLRKLDWSPIWLDAGLASQSVGDLIAYLTRTPRGASRRILLVIDDVQARPSLVRHIACILHILTCACATPVSLLLMAWESAADLISEAIPNVRIVPCTGQQVLPDLIRASGPTLDKAEVESVFERARGNVLVARLVLGSMAASRRLPQPAELAQLAWGQVCGPAALTRAEIDALYRISALTQFQIDSTDSFAAAGSPAVVRSLVGRGVVRRTENGLSVGHPALGGLLCHYIRTNLPGEEQAAPEPAMVALEYLRAAGNQVIATTLERLDFASLADAPIDQHGTAMLARAWECFEVLVRNIASQTVADPTWGDNLASAVFAGMALAEVGHPEWAALASYIRARWTYLSDATPPRAQDGMVSAERKDFDLIRDAMIAEDEFGYHATSAATIDLDRTHRTWALGLLLCFEGSARQRDIERIERLKAIATKIQEPNGAFYPERIPWVTARVVLGLCAAGETVTSSSTVRLACEWLCKGPPGGPFRLVRWESGTGAWNSPEQTTALCLEALLKAGVDFAQETVRAALPTLTEARRAWGQPGKEMDAACGLQTFLLADRRWRTVIRELEQVLVWARAREPWTGATRPCTESGTESSNVPYVANALIGIIWQIVVSELPLLLEQMAMPDSENIAEAPQRRSPAMQRAMLAALGEIHAHIDNNLRSRETIARQLGQDGFAAVKDEHEKWKVRRTRVESIERAWGEGDEKSANQEKDLALVDSADQLGNECAGGAWRTVSQRIKDETDA